ncbi:hypothetical protein ACS0TY_024942 [Phlomoides rotata]
MWKILILLVYICHRLLSPSQLVPFIHLRNSPSPITHPTARDADIGAGRHGITGKDTGFSNLTSDGVETTGSSSSSSSNS